MLRQIIFKNRRIRITLIQISNYIFEEKIMDYLYPDDCIIEFGGGKD